MKESKKPIVIFGAGAMGQEIWREFVAAGKDEVVAFSVDREYINETKLHGLPVVPYEDLASQYPPDEFQIIIGISYGDHGMFRIRRYEEVLGIGYEFARCVSRWAITWESLNLGYGSSLFAGTTLSPSSSVGKNVIISHDCTIPHDCLVGDHSFFSTGVRLSGNATVEQGVFIGTGAIVRNGVTIGANSLIGAGAVILENVEPNSVYMAAPAERLPVNRQVLDMK